MKNRLSKSFLQFSVFMLVVLNSQVLGSDKPDVIVDAKFTGEPGASVEGIPVFRSIGDALEAGISPESVPYQVFIRAGDYREKLVIVRAGVHLTGESQTDTLISWNDSGDSPGLDGKPVGTAGSATLTITAPRFRAENLTITNDFDYAANAALPDGSPGKVSRMQAVAVATGGNSDKAVFENVTIGGFQDTLLVDTGRHYFRDCRILGHVDFIFGAGQAVFERCDIVSRNRIEKNPTGYITAPSTDVAHPYGFLFLDSRLVKESADIPAASVRLGRPWHPGANPKANGSAVFINCFMDDHIGPKGFAPISGVNSSGERVWFEVDERSRFFEYGSSGPGAIESGQRPRLNAEQAKWYSASQVLAGWNPWGNFDED